MKRTSLTLLLSVLLLTSFISILPIAATHAQPTAVLFVSPSGSDTSGNGSPGNPYATISHAVRVAPAGAEVIVMPGTYAEMVSITSLLYLVGESGNPSNTIINAAGLTHGIEVIGAATSGTIIEGFTVENANAQGIFVQDASDVLISNNQVLNNAQDTSLPCPFSGPITSLCIFEDKGIELIGTNDSSVAGNTVVGTVADGGIGLSDNGLVGNPGIPENATNPFPSGTPSPSMDNVVTDNTIIANTGGCGVVVASYNPGEGVIGNVVASNDIVANGEGVVVATVFPGTSAINNTVIGNSVLNSFAEGIDIDASGGASAPSNVFSGNSVIGNVVSGNGPDGDFSDPAPTGIAVISPTSHMVDGTTVTGNIVRNEHYGLAVANATGTTILSNDISPTVAVPIFGAMPSQNPISSISSELNSLQASLAQLQSSAASQTSVSALSGTVNAANSALNSLNATIGQLQSSSAKSSDLNALSSTVTSLQNSLTQLQSSAAKQSDLSSLTNSVNGISSKADSANSQAQTATDLGYVAIVVAVVFGGIAIALSLRRPSAPSPK